MLKLYYHPSPNPLKIALYLEESNLPYELVPIDTRKGEQHSPAFLKINPNAKTPALVDGEISIFDSTAILLYLSEKTGQFLPPDTPADRAEMLQWLMFVATGIGPYCGQAVHFKYFAPEPKEYAVNRYLFEAERHWGLIEAHLAGKEWMVAGRYTLVDMAVWGWSRMVPRFLGDGAWAGLPNVKRHLDAINSRPAAQKAEALKERFSFKQDMDAEARKALFPGNAQIGAL